MRVLRSIWAILVWLFVALLPIQFYLAGHGAMEGAHAADKNIHVMSTAWDPHSALGTIMGLLAILILILGLASRLPRPIPGHTGGLFVAMLVQFILPFFNDSASTRWIAALHGLNALVVTGAAVTLALRARPWIPIARFRTEEPVTL
jgi:Family of unknown function (DUF6220)